MPYGLEGLCMSEKRLGRPDSLLIYSNLMTNNRIADFETSDTTANLDDLTRDVCAEDKWAFDSGEHHVAYILFRLVY